MGKALGSAGIASGDIVYIGAGTYREGVTVSMTSATSTTSVIGDVDGAQTGDAGEVVLSGYTSGDNATPGAFQTILLNGRDFLSFSHITVVAGSGNNQCVDGTTTNSTNITFSDCTFLAGSGSGVSWVSYTGVASTAAHWLIERCYFGPGQTGFLGLISISVPLNGTADHDIDFIVQNCFFWGNCDYTIKTITTASGSFKPGGVKFYNNTVFGSLVATVGTGWSTALPVIVANNLVMFGEATTTNAPYIAASNGQLIEDYNRASCGAGLNGSFGTVSVGPKTSYNYTPNPQIEVGQSIQSGKQLRPVGTPVDGSLLLGLGCAELHTAKPSTGATATGIGTIAWTTPGNATALDATYAVATSIPITTGASNWLQVTGGLAVPGGATILAVRVEIVAKAAAVTSLSMNSIKLIKAGTISGNDLASSNTNQFTAADALYSYGNSSDPLWGLTLTASDVNASNFGVALSIKNTAASTRTASIDYVRIIVAYAPTYSVDLLNRPRPAGGHSLLYAVGCLERHDTAVQETTTIDAGGSGWRIDGPGDHDIFVPVNAESTTITIRSRFDTTYAGVGQKPQAQLLANGQIGVGAQTVTMTAAANTWDTITLGPFTPTAMGWVTIRLVSKPDTGAGVAFFDTLNY